MSPEEIVRRLMIVQGLIKPSAVVYVGDERPPLTPEQTREYKQRLTKAGIINPQGK